MMDEDKDERCTIKWDRKRTRDKGKDQI